MPRTGWIDVDLDGFAKLVEHRGKVMVLNELIQNALDEDTKVIDVVVEKMPNRPLALVRVTDDNPTGFKDLTHAHTMFAESFKKDDPTKRGRFNMGEKIVLALCRQATVKTTSGTVRFHADGLRTFHSKERTTTGSVFEGHMRMTTEELEEALRGVRRLLLPPGVEVRVNGETLKPRDPLRAFEVTLPTVRADEEGALRPTRRKTTVRLYEILEGESPSIYEMGIPVVGFGDRYHVDVAQRVPVNLERDNVPPAYLKTLRAAVLNNAAEDLDEEAAAESWVTDGLGHKDVKPEAIDAVLTARYGKKRAVFDPSDTEANDRLRSQGYTLVHGASLPKDAWAKIKATPGLLTPAGQLSPTHARNFAEAKPWAPSADTARVEKLTRALGRELLGIEVAVEFLDAPEATVVADFSSSDKEIRFNIGHPSMGSRWLTGPLHSIVDLIIHEFGHFYEGNHYSKAYNDALTDLGGRLVVVSLRQPELFEGFPLN